MLEHEPLESESVSHASKARVSPEELIAALNAIEKRKSTESESSSNTLEIGEAIKELGIRATPDEILREVNAQRYQNSPEGKAARAETERKAAQARADAEAKQKWDVAAVEAKKGAASAAILVSSLIQDATEVYQKNKARRQQRAMSRCGSRKMGIFWKLVIVAGILALLDGYGMFGYHPKVVTIATVLPAIQAPAIRAPVAGSNVTLSEMANGETLYCDAAGIDKILASGGTVAQEDSSVVLTRACEDDDFGVEMVDGKLYLQGYAPHTGINALGTGVVDVYCEPSVIQQSGVVPSAITIPLSGARDIGQPASGTDRSEIKLKDITVDKNTDARDAG
jgi:hypothetical protein